jgi:hypothetical protein
MVRPATADAEINQPESVNRPMEANKVQNANTMPSDRPNQCFLYNFK